MPTDKELYKALRTLTDYCGYVSCEECKIKDIVDCDVDEDSYSNEMIPVPMYWDNIRLEKLDCEEE